MKTRSAAASFRLAIFLTIAPLPPSMAAVTTAERVPGAWSTSQRRRLRRSRQERARLAGKPVNPSLAAHALLTGNEATARDIRQIVAASLQDSDAQQAHDSRLVQRLLWALAERREWSDEILLLLGDDIVELSKDKHWNFVVQHIVTLCDPAQLEVICLLLGGRAAELALHRIGCRVLCRVCEQAHACAGALTLLSELSGDLRAYVEDENANFVVLKLLENVESFPGMDQLLLQCCEQPEKSRRVIGFLSEASELQKLRAEHLEALLAWPGFEQLKDGRTPEKIVYEAAQLHARESKKSNGLDRESATSTSLSEGLAVQRSEKSSATQDAPFFAGYWCAVFAPILDPWGRFQGCVFQGYQLIQMCHPPKEAGLDGRAVASGSETSEAAASPVEPAQLGWELSKRNAKRLQDNSPSVLHLGKRTCGGRTFGLDLVTLVEASSSSELRYKAALKLLDGPPRQLRVTFGLQSESVRHDFLASRVCISTVLEIPLETLLNPKGTLTLNVRVSS